VSEDSGGGAEGSIRGSGVARPPIGRTTVRRPWQRVSGRNRESARRGRLRGPRAGRAVGSDGPGARGRRFIGRVRGGTHIEVAPDVERDPAQGGTGAARPVGRVPAWSPTHDQLMLLAALDEAGVRTEQAFASLARAAGDRTTRAAATHVAQRVREGAQLSAALSEVSVPAHVVALVAGGERSGRLSEALRGASELVRRVAMLGQALRRALVYPTVVLGVGLVIVLFVSFVIVPPLERTFADLGGELPTATRVVLRTSAALRSVWVPVAITVMILALRWSRTVVRRPAVARLRERMPRLGRLQRDLDIAVLARTCATMLPAGIPIVDVLRTTAEPMRPGQVCTTLLRCASQAERGEGLFGDGGLGELLRPVECEMLLVAEASGLEAEQWARLAERRAEALEERVRRVGALLEPLLVVLVGLVVGGAVLALYLPTFRALELL
jgi:type II secretory pathway component PulF